MFFDGNVKSLKKVSAIGKKKSDAASRNDIIENARRQREQRSHERQRQDSARNVQSLYRGYIQRVNSIGLIREGFDKKVADIVKLETIFSMKNIKFFLPLDVFCSLVRSLSYFYDASCDYARVAAIVRLLHSSITNISPNYNILAIDSNDKASWSRVRIVKKIFLMSWHSILHCGIHHIHANGAILIDAIKSCLSVLISDEQTLSPSTKILILHILSAISCRAIPSMIAIHSTVKEISSLFEPILELVIRCCKLSNDVKMTVSDGTKRAFFDSIEKFNSVRLRHFKILYIYLLLIISSNFCKILIFL
jgi:hypothetical protein